MQEKDLSMTSPRKGAKMNKISYFRAQNVERVANDAFLLSASQREHLADKNDVYITDQHITISAKPERYESPGLFCFIW